VGKAYHAYSDSLSPTHSGFQIWYGPVDGVNMLGAVGYARFLKAHRDGETMGVYNGMKALVVDSVKVQFQGIIDELLKE